MEFRFALRDNGMRAAFQLLHMVLEVWVLSLHNILTRLTIGKTKFFLKHEIAFTKFTSLYYSIMCG